MFTSPTYGRVSFDNIVRIIHERVASDEDGQFNLMIGTDSQMAYKNSDNAIEYDNHGVYDRNLYHHDINYIEKNREVSFRDSIIIATSNAGANTIREKITALYNVILQNEVKGAMDEKLIGDVIVKLISSWKGEDSADLTVLVSEKDAKAVEQVLMNKLADKVKKGLDVKASKNIDAGFHVEAKDGSAYHNFSAEGIAEVFADYLNPRLANLLAEGIKKAEA